MCDLAYFNLSLQIELTVLHKKYHSGRDGSRPSCVDEIVLDFGLCRDGSGAAYIHAMIGTIPNSHMHKADQGIRLMADFHLTSVKLFSNLRLVLKVILGAYPSQS